MLVKIYVDFENKKVWSVNKISDAENVMEYVKTTVENAIKDRFTDEEEQEKHRSFLHKEIKRITRNYLNEECVSFVDDVELNDTVKLWINFSERWVSWFPIDTVEAVGVFNIALTEEYL